MFWVRGVRTGIMLLPTGASSRNDMLAAEISIWSRWIVQNETLRRSVILAYELPGRSEVVLGPSNLEVINVYDKENLEGRMYETTTPIRNCFKSLFLQVAFAMSFP
eukprot:8246726-Prorocentrum_lima.AAC.1